MKQKTNKDVCSFCGGVLEAKTVRYLWERQEHLAVIEGLVAKVCKRCGHRWFPAKSVRRLEAAFSGKCTPAGTISLPLYSLGDR